MICKKPAPVDILPWYRSKNYQGPLTEKEKRILDSYRLADKHPSASYDDLPSEVQRYIGHLEHELRDSRLRVMFNGCAFLSFLGILMIYNWWHYPQSFSFIMPWSSLVIILVPWIYFVYGERKLTRDYRPEDDPVRPTNEGIKRAWEEEVSRYLITKKQEEDRI